MSLHRRQPSTTPLSKTLPMALACAVGGGVILVNLGGFADSQASDQAGIT